MHVGPKFSFLRATRLTRLLLCVVLTGCATPTPRTSISATHTRVDYEAVAAAASERYQLQPGESAKQPVLIERPAPAYPASMLALHLPEVSVQARVVVDAQGKVSDVRITHDPAASPYPTAFDDAVRETVRQWRYSPLQFQRWQDEYDADGNLMDSHKVAAENRPFSLDYVFHFTLRDGKPFVSNEATKASN
jgi:TonB family protein